MRTITDPRVEKAHRVDLHVGQRVRERRKSERMSQIELALRLGLTFQQVQKYERGGNRISASKLFEIADALRTPIGWFFEGLETKHPQSETQGTSSVQAFLQSTGGIDLGEAYLTVRNIEQRRILLDLMRSMATPA